MVNAPFSTTCSVFSALLGEHCCYRFPGPIHHVGFNAGSYNGVNNSTIAYTNGGNAASSATTTGVVGVFTPGQIVPESKNNAGSDGFGIVIRALFKSVITN